MSKKKAKAEGKVEKKKTGRPYEGRDAKVTVYLKEEDAAALKEEAEASDRSISRLGARIITDWLYGE